MAENITNADGVRLLTPDEVAKRLKLSAHQVRWLIREDRIDGVVKRGRSFFVPESSLDTITYKPMGPKPAKKGRTKK